MASLTTLEPGLWDFEPSLKSLEPLHVSHKSLKETLNLVKATSTPSEITFWNLWDISKPPGSSSRTEPSLKHCLDLDKHFGRSLTAKVTKQKQSKEKPRFSARFTPIVPSGTSSMYKDCQEPSQYPPELKLYQALLKLEGHTELSPGCLEPHQRLI